MPNSIIIVYGTDWCRDCRRAKGVLERFHIPYEWINIDIDPSAEAFVLVQNKGLRIVPTILFPDSTILTEPSNQCLMDKLREFIPLIPESADEA